MSKLKGAVMGVTLY